MSATTFDPSQYTRSPILTMASGITLCGALVDACPDDAPAGVKKASKKLAKVADGARAAWSARKQKLAKVSDASAQLLDQEADWSWSALRMRLQAYALLPVDRYPLAPRAGELVVLLFGDEGLDFLKSAYPEQSASMASVLDRIDGEKLAKEIEGLAGKEFVAQVRHVQPRYDAMVKAMLQRDETTGENLLDQVRAMQGAIVMYATKVAATADEDDLDSIEVVRAALRAIDNHRVALGRRAGAKGAAAAEDGAAPAGEAKPVG